jgi:DNA-binding NtrC family response regulator
MESESDNTQRDSIPDSGEQIRVLYLESEGSDAQEWAERLERANEALEVTITFDPKSALDQLHDEPVDCLLSGYDLQGSNGLEVLEQVRESYSELPFILLTDDGSEEIASDAITAGVTNYFRKDWDDD